VGRSGGIAGVHYYVCSGSVGDSYYLRRRVRTGDNDFALPLAPSVLSDDGYASDGAGTLWNGFASLGTMGGLDAGDYVCFAQLVVVTALGSDGSMLQLEYGGTDGECDCRSDFIDTRT